MWKAAQAMFALEAQVEVTPAPPGPAEKVLTWAEQLPESRPQLEAEAQRLEGLLSNLAQPASQVGGELMQALVGVLELQLDGVYSLLDYDLNGDQELLQHGLTQLLQSDANLQQLESDVESVRAEVPLLG